MNDRFSVGGGLDYFNVFDAELNQKIPNPDGAGGLLDDGHATFSGKGTAWGYNVGALMKLSDRHSLGLSYRSQTNVNVTGRVQLTGLSGMSELAFGGPSYESGGTSNFAFPQSLAVGYGFHPNDRWTVYADYEWFEWSSTQETKFDYEQNNSELTQSIPRHWKNSNNLGLGAQLKGRRNDIRFGMALHEQVVPDSTLESAIPDAGRIAAMFGMGHHFGDVTINWAYGVCFLKKRTVDNDAGTPFASMDGSYKSNFQVYSLDVAYRFLRPR